MNFRRLIALLTVSLSFTFAQAQDATQPATVTEQTLFLTYVPNIQFAPVYVAMAKGYYEDEGISLTVEHGDEPLGVDLIAAGQRQFGIISGEQVIAARAQGRPVVTVYEWFQQFPIAVVAASGSGINTIEDLRGRTVGVAGRFGASYSGLVALLAANGMTEADIQVQEIGFSAPEVFCVGAVEAVVVYINNEPLQIANRVAANDCGMVEGITVIPAAESVNIVSNGLITNEATLADNPELVAQMVRAFDHGVRDAIRNPAETYLLSAPYIENLPISDELTIALSDWSAQIDATIAADETADLIPLYEQMREALSEAFEADFLLQFDVLLATTPLWQSEPLGTSDLASWETTQQTLIAMGFVESPIDLESAFTNAYLPED